MVPFCRSLADCIFDCNLPCAAIIGLGYEIDIAVGTLEAIEPERVIAFYPKGRDIRFEHQVLAANQPIFDGTLSTIKIGYSVEGPLQIYNSVMAVCGDLIEDYRPVLIPFGPKIFAAMAILASLAHSRKIPVWRVSPVDLEEPVSVHASGVVISFRCNWVQ